MWKVAVCDDDEITYQEISRCLKQYNLEQDFQLEYIPSGKELIFRYQEEKYNLIYLDIIMPEKNGIETAQALRQQGCNAAIIFLTNYDEYLEIGYEVNAFRYRFKPVDPILFQRDIEAWRSAQNNKQSILLRTKSGNYQVSKIEMIYLEVKNRKVQIVTIEGNYISLENMQYWEKLLSDFLVPYNKILVNREHVKFFDATRVITTQDYELPMSRRKYQQFCAEMLK